MEKICFVVGLYGDEVNGGAEKHCKMLAERASKYYEVEVLTSTFKNYTTFSSYFSEGIEIINDVKVHRFSSEPFDSDYFKSTYKRSRSGRKVRRFLYKTGILKSIANLFPTWNLSLKKEIESLKANGLYSPELIQHIQTNQVDYRAIMLVSYPCPNFYFIVNSVPNKTILIPTAHNEGDFFRSYLSQIFTTVKHIAFNTTSEQELCQRIFGKKMSNSSILAVGIEIAEPTSKLHIQEKYNLPEKYILYFGRIAKEKIGLLIEWFLEFKKKSSNSIKLVLTGGLYMDKISHPDILYTGFVDESEKTALIQYAELVVNPSDRESLSLLLLEAMQLGKPTLVNGKSDVLKQHCIDSSFAAQYYMNKTDFLFNLETILNSTESEKLEIKNKAKEYVYDNYSWDIILIRLTRLINKI